VSFLLNPACEGMLPELNMNGGAMSGMLPSDSMPWQAGGRQSWKPQLRPESPALAVLWAQGLWDRQGWQGDSKLAAFCQKTQYQAPCASFAESPLSSGTNT